MTVLRFSTLGVGMALKSECLTEGADKYENDQRHVDGEEDPKVSVSRIILVIHAEKCTGEGQWNEDHGDECQDLDVLRLGY